MRIIHLKGTQFAIPTWYRIWHKPTYKEFSATFDERAIYVQSDVNEQADWLKLVGISFFINAMHESVMVSWRWNEEKQVFQFGAYFHVDKGVNKSEPLFELPRTGGTFTFSIGIDYDDKKYTVFLPRVSKSKTFTHDKSWARSINPYAGGTLNMPKTICFDLNYL